MPNHKIESIHIDNNNGMSNSSVNVISKTLKALCGLEHGMASTDMMVISSNNICQRPKNLQLSPILSLETYRRRTVYTYG